MKEELFEKIGQIFAQNPDLYRQRSGDDEKLDKFYKRFPVESLPDITLEDYCLGKGSKPESFCWWIERGLEKSLGRYSPGTSRGHLIYLKPDRSYYIHGKLKDLGAEDALRAVAKIAYTVASFDSLADALIIDDRTALAKRAGIGELSLVGGTARFLRILAIYHPDWMIPINSRKHFVHFLEQFSDEPDPELPKGSMGGSHALSAILHESRREIDPDISPWGFSRLLYHPDLDIPPPKLDKSSFKSTPDDIPDAEISVSIPLNQILYGPPGTGKTYETVERALAIIDPEILSKTDGEKDQRTKRKARFDELVAAKQIGFVTFHQSFSYEDFVEGLKATVDDETQQIRYDVEEGVFKKMADDASAAFHQKQSEEAGHSSTVELREQQVWKMSLGEANQSGSLVFEDCIEKGIALLGWGNDVDFTGVSDRDGIVERLTATAPETKAGDYAITACNMFVNKMKKGDLVVVSDGNYKLRAIGEITGDYRFLDEDEEQDSQYRQCRDVKWHRVFSPSLSHDQLMSKVISQASIYRLKPPALVMRNLEELLKSNSENSGPDSKAKPYVLIIDEINRGNISRVFGELITLIEDSKRLGQPEALTVRLPYSKTDFSVPENLYLIGTMNTADRSLAQIDIALRRRFHFDELMPQPQMLNSIPPIEGIHVGKMLKTINDRIEALYDREHTIGHTFFLSLRDDPSIDELGRIFSGKILPLLEEYFFEDWEKIRLVLADHRKSNELAMIRPRLTGLALAKLFGEDSEHSISTAYERNEEALGSPDSYIAIYAPQTPATIETAL